MAFKIISTLRFDPMLGDDAFYMLERHRNRLLRSAQNFGWQAVVAKLQGDQGLNDLRAYLSWVTSGCDSPLRLGLRIDEQGSWSVDVQPTPGLLLPDLLPVSLDREPRKSKHSPWPVYLDTVATMPSPFTRHKTSCREVYDQARARIELERWHAAEVILRNDQGELMDGSITTVYFWRDNAWVTPRLSSGALDGVTREYSLNMDLAKEGIVLASSLEVGEKVYLSNGNRGFIPGFVSVPPRPPK